MDIVIDKKPELIKWLSGESIHILQHVQSGKFITQSQYDHLMSIPVPSDKVIKLLDIIIRKGQRVCLDFLIMLKEDDVNEFSPQLRNWIRTVNTSDTTPSGSRLSSTARGNEDRERGESGNRAIPAMEFLRNNHSLLVQGVKNIDPVVDDLALHSELVANVRAERTPQDKMRKLLGFMNSQAIAQDLVDALFNHERNLMNEIYN